VIRKSSFTLIEVLISLGLFAGLAVTCVTLLDSLSDSMDSQNERSKHVESLVLLDRTVKKMFTNMVPFKWRDEDNQIVPHFAGYSDKIRFSYLNRINNLEDGGLRFAELYVDEEEQLVAHYQTRPFRDALEPDSSAYVSVLSEQVESVALSYVSVTENEQGSENLEWLEDWEEDRLDIPLGVKLTVNWLDGTAESFFWRTAGNGYFERWGAWRNGEKINR
jgi:type II secretory pathway component PulJ